MTARLTAPLLVLNSSVMSGIEGRNMSIEMGAIAVRAMSMPSAARDSALRTRPPAANASAKEVRSCYICLLLVITMWD